MDFPRYQKYLIEYISLARRESDGTNRGIHERLSEMKVSGLLVRNRVEKTRALEDARKAFDEHRHWPLEIVLTQLGLKKEQLDL